MWFIDVLKLRPQTTSTFHLWLVAGAPWPSTTRQPFLSSTVTRSPISVPKDPLHSFPLEKTFSSASLIKFDEILKFYSEANYPQPALNALRSLSHQRGTAECKTEAPHQKTSRFSCFLWDKIKNFFFQMGFLPINNWVPLWWSWWDLKCELFRWNLCNDRLILAEKMKSSNKNATSVLILQICLKGLLIKSIDFWLCNFVTLTMASSYSVLVIREIQQ